MKSKNTLYTTSQKTIKPNQKWTENFKEQLQKIKRPFLNRVEYSKLRIESRIQNFKSQKQAWTKYEGIIQCLIQKVLRNQLPPANQQNQIAQQFDEFQSQKQILLLKDPKLKFQDDSDQQKQNEVHIDNYFAQWPGRDKQKIFKNSSNMLQQYERVFNKKIGICHSKKKTSYSYRKQQKLMLQKIYTELKDPSNNVVTFEKIYNFFDDCKLFFTVYGINPAELQDIVSCSAHKYPNKLTKEEFFELFLVNTQSRNYDELQNKVQKVCCMNTQDWDQLKKIFNQLDTFGSSKIITKEFFHKMKTISASKQLLESQTIYFPNVNRHYTFNKVLFVLQHKNKLPQSLTWAQLQNLINNFSHIDYPTVDQIYQKQIKTAIIQNETNTFLLKEQTLKILKEQFQRCPKFSQHFVKCKYFCEELMSIEAINIRSKQSVRINPNGKGLINLQTNIRLLQLQGPQYFDMDEMLTFFSVKGFQTETKLEKYKDSFDLQSTSSEQDFEEKKKQQRRAKRMKSLDQIEKIMRKTNEPKFQANGQLKKIVFKPVQVQQFNLTKPRDHLTIRQRKVKQMIEQKQRKQKEQIKPFIPANPIPASINCQRYLDQKSKQQTKRQLQRQKRQKLHEEQDKKLKHLMSNTKLFEKRDPFLIQQQKRKYFSPQPKLQFEAKPISWFIKQRNLLEVIESEKQQKRKNRLRQTKQKYVFGYWKDMPYQGDSNFKKMTIVKNLEKEKSDNSIQLQIRQINDGLEKQKALKLKTTTVPDFNKLQRQFMEELESKKRMRNPTVIKEFNLSVSRKKQVQLDEENIFVKSPSPKKTLNAQQAKSSNPNQPIIVGTTKKFENMVQLTQRKLAQRKYEQELKELQEQQRKNKQKVFAKFMKKALLQQNKKRKGQSQRTTRRKKQQQNSLVQHDNQLQKIYERVLNRPFLFQTDAYAGQKMKKKVKKSNNNSMNAVQRKQLPKKIMIPKEEDELIAYPEIPHLNYIQEYPNYQQNERFYEDGTYDNNDQYMGRDFQGDQNEYYDYQEQPSESQKEGNQKISNFEQIRNLNQSF